MAFTSGQILTAAQLNTFEPGTKIKNQSGTASAPSYAFDGDNDTGMFRTGADAVGITTGGTLRLTIDSAGNVGIGTPTPAKELDVHGASNPEIRILSTDASDPSLVFGDSVDGARASIYYDTSEDRLIFRGYDNANRMTIGSSGNVGIGTLSPAEELHILKDQDGVLTQTLVENIDQRLRLGAYYEAGVAQYSKIQSEADNGSDQALLLNPEGGNVGIGTTSPTYPLDVSGNSRVTGIARFENDVRGKFGSAADPSFTFDGDADTGLYRQGADELGVSTGGAERFRVGSFGIRGDDTGNLYNWNRFQGNNGSASSPTFTFDSDTNTGMYRDGTDSISFATGGTQRLDIDGGGIKGKVPFSGPFGSAGAPGFSFDGDTDTGFFRGPGSGVISWSGNTTQGGYMWNGGIRTLDGTAGNPAYSFMSDSNTGIFRNASDDIGFTTGGARRMTISSGALFLDNGVDFFVFPDTGTGNDAEWVATGFGNYQLKRNSSLTAEKENITDDLGTYLTADMIDQVVPKLWNRIHTPGYPEIGPLAEDMDAISPFLAAHGADIRDGTYQEFVSGINKTSYLSLLVLAVKDLRARVATLEAA